MYSASFFASASLLLAFLSSKVSSRGFDRRQDSTPTLTTGCGDADLTPANWNANDIDAVVTGTPGFGQSANFPQQFVAQFNTNQFTNDPFDCTNFNDPGACLIPGPFPDNVFCDTFSNPQVGFIVQSWINLYNNLRNMYYAIQDAHDQLVSEGYIAAMVNDISPQPLPISRSTLLKLVDLSLDFIPIPGAGAEVAAIKTVLKTFKKIAGKVVDKAQQDVDDAPQTLQDQPQILQTLLDNAVPNVQAAIMDQLQAVFVDAQPDDSSAQILLGGVQLNPVPSQSDYATIMAQNLRTFLLAEAMNKIQMLQIVDNIVADCDSGPEDTLSADGSQCRRFGLPEGDGTIPTAVTIDHPNAMGDLEGRFGFSIAAIADNAQACAAAGQDFSNVDFDGFLESDTPGVYPTCLFGVPSHNENF
ncbi:uncharacterized protein Z520_11676 [Fonsecaea multimorphosa CBS 102226]|uniref:Uncharacterized protein n=1 Tax=Fonsecaea multimorphosa CBS 102226 TaxID=1442371 RepID=A0A0D2JHH7_9EURO|nr:uncharacterized protein Z520_11676 [Fonsecaea multimorphosa CBS 102226]KIX92647.1 hypothetical protein Z520_11676 [Fonsecaea multimorphosa CBS 102226]OAL17871.1 hypothetical protein AYO22_11215 [Fonsecaea multimorphosa]